MDYVIQLNYYNYLDYRDYIHLLSTNKEYYYSPRYNNDLIYKFYLVNKFSEKFVYVVNPIIISYYDCLVRIINFENWVKQIGYDVWDEDIYYIFWKAKKCKINSY